MRVDIRQALIDFFRIHRIIGDKPTKACQSQNQYENQATAYCSYRPGVTSIF